MLLSLLLGNVYDDDDDDDDYDDNILGGGCDCNSTWSYENRVSKHFVIFLNFPCLIACLLCCLLMSFFFGCFVVRVLCRRGCRQNYYLNPPPFLFLTHNSLFNTSDSYLKSVRA